MSPELSYNTGYIVLKKDLIDENIICTSSDLVKMIDCEKSGRLAKFFFENDHRLIYKYLHYFQAYEEHFSKYRGKDVTLLEIGVFKGGSLQMWNEYYRSFGVKVKKYGIDIDSECKKA